MDDYDYLEIVLKEHMTKHEYDVYKKCLDEKHKKKKKKKMSKEKEMEIKWFADKIMGINIDHI